ncbi:Myb-related protein 308 [Acorus gramineus]|uniref:Myb-related protein 308 n=1 Tax=Acorus gramineus TaxID=55184 RepID=A0AAV9AAU2_ACOGR|nr:Myb-related protein 308 [Acorus gramineus]
MNYHFQKNKDKLSEEEQKFIGRIHAEFGNKWSIIASKMPGRTANEIKNYWNVKTRRLNSQSQHLHGKQWQLATQYPLLVVSPPTCPTSHPQQNMIPIPFHVDQNTTKPPLSIGCSTPVGEGSSTGIQKFHGEVKNLIVSSHSSPSKAPCLKREGLIIYICFS